MLFVLQVMDNITQSYYLCKSVQSVVKYFGFLLRRVYVVIIVYIS
jgi:hypothetical protein